jgi:hypothetical protein
VKYDTYNSYNNTQESSNFRFPGETTGLTSISYTTIHVGINGAPYNIIQHTTSLFGSIDYVAM